MRFEPKKYLNELVAGRESGLVKIIMGVRRCGKSFLLLGLISIGGILCSCQVKTDWREKPLASDLQFTQLARSWDEGIPLGNATVGALLWQRDSALRFSLDRTDLWDLRPMDSISGSNNRFSWVYSQVQKGDYLPVQKKYDWPYDQLPAPSKIPGAALEFPLEKLGEPNDIRLYLNNALCEARWDNGATLKTFVHATEPVGWFVFENLPDTICPSLIAPKYNKPVAAGDNDPVTGLDLRRLGYEQGTLRTEKQEITYHQPGWILLRRECTLETKRQKVVWRLECLFFIVVRQGFGSNPPSPGAWSGLGLQCPHGLLEQLLASFFHFHTRYGLAEAIRQ